MGCVTIDCDKIYVQATSISEEDYNIGDVNLLRDGTRAIVRNLATAANKYVFGLLQTVETSADVTLSSKEAIAQLFAVCDENGADPFDSTLVLNASSYASVISNYGGAEVYGHNGDGIARAVLDSGLLGFKYVCCVPYLPSGDVGAIIPAGTLCVVSKINRPVFSSCYDSVWDAVTDDKLGVSMRAFQQPESAKAIVAGSLMLGASIVQDGIIRLV